MAYLTLKAHFAGADNYPRDPNYAQLGKLMLVQQQNPSVEHGAPTFVGEYYEACKVYARENKDEMNQNNISLDKDEMNQNNISLDNLLKSQPSTYWTGVNLGNKASTVKRQLLNEIHTVFCQEVNKQSVK